MSGYSLKIEFFILKFCKKIKIFMKKYVKSII